MKPIKPANSHLSPRPTRESSSSKNKKAASIDPEKLRQNVLNLEGNLEKIIRKSKESTSEKEKLTGCIKKFISGLDNKEKIKFAQLSPSAQLRILSEYAERKEAIEKGEQPGIAGVGSRIATRELMPTELTQCFSKEIGSMLDTMIKNEKSKEQTIIGSVLKNIKISIKNLFNKP